MQNPEQELMYSIAHGLAIKVPRAQPSTCPSIKRDLVAGELWPAGDASAWLPKDAWDNTNPQSSQNWPLLAVAAKLLLGTAAQKAEADATGIAILTRQKTQTGWMGSEIGSRVYAVFGHAEPIAIMLKLGSPQLKALAQEWFNWFWFWLLQAKMVGQRSAEPGREQPQPIDDLRDYALGTAAFPMKRNSTEMCILEVLELVFEQSLRAFLALGSNRPFWKTATSVFFFADGVVVALGLNSNTPAVLAWTEEGNRFLPAPPYIHVREQADLATAVNTGKLGDGNPWTFKVSSKFYPPASVTFSGPPVAQLGVGILPMSTAAPVTPSAAAPAPVPVAPAAPKPPTHGLGCALLPAGIVTLLALLLKGMLQVLR